MGWFNSIIGFDTPPNTGLKLTAPPPFHALEEPHDGLDAGHHGALGGARLPVRSRRAASLQRVSGILQFARYQFVETSAQGFHGLAPIFLDTSQATRWRLMSQEWRYVITGQHNSTSFTAFEYRSVETFTGNDPVIVTPTTPRDRRKQTYGVLLWEQADARLPQFVMVPETMWKRFEEALGQQNIRFPDDPGFSGLYRLQGYDEPAVRRLFTPDVRNHLRQHGRLHLAGFQTQLVWWTDARLPSATQLPAFLAEGDALRRLFFTP